MLERDDRVQLVVREGRAECDGLWIHPGALYGLLLGVSLTTVGWEWSEQPARVESL